MGTHGKQLFLLGMMLVVLAGCGGGGAGNGALPGGPPISAASSATDTRGSLWHFFSGCDLSLGSNCLQKIFCTVLDNTYAQFFGWTDNPDGRNSASIKYPGLHKTAGGVGTYDDPVSFGSDPAEFWPVQPAANGEPAVKAGQKIYIPALKKYFIMETDCAYCSSDWAGLNTAQHQAATREINIWIGGNSSSRLSSCENSLTSAINGANFIANPPQGLPVDVTPLFNAANSQCYQVPKSYENESCSYIPPTPAPTATPKPTATPTPVPTATPKPTATPTPVPTATPTPQPTATPVQTPNVIPLPSPSSSACASPTAVPTISGYRKPPPTPDPGIGGCTS